MFKITKKLTLNLKILRFFIIPSILVSTPFFYDTQDAKAGLEFQWNQDSSFRRLKWYQIEDKRKFRNTIYFFLRPSDRRTDLLKINLAMPKTFNPRRSGLYQFHSYGQPKEKSFSSYLGSWTIVID